ncbi:MAG: redoxin family protein [Spirochaetota bacterium]|nr:MAG: redoxin family protein [Spirochaetota bacterium]
MNMKKTIGMALFLVMLFAVYMAIGDDMATKSTNWRDITLKDVKTGRTFKVADFNGKPIILETFAVWCPTCTKQQREIKKLHSEIGDEFVSITLDVDPNESEKQVKEHLKRNGFDWLYAVAPPEFTKLLIDEFGTIIVNAPAAPVVIIDENGDARLLGRGVKSAQKLKAELKKRG